ncbi:hypothetical protein NQ315_001222 [Exocentrus adspersus]|uniref:Uncharacterized protein n=1 Tax=Exocentrus adspersus TaxID=1586481 RepID=A0AAV8WF23_9CUCU|nr:hypothetical protein NQ315_001222 [Exocentrus adspersus]
MTDDRPHVPRAKGRSASICAASHSSSMEAIPPSGASPDAGTPQTRRRRPAARSQSARLTHKRSIKSRASIATGANGLKNTTSNSEPKLAEQDTTPDVSPNIRRKGSQRRGTSVYQRKSTAFLDVPEPRGRSNSNTEEEDEDSYRLRSFSFTSKESVTSVPLFINTFVSREKFASKKNENKSNLVAGPPAGTVVHTSRRIQLNTS